MKYFLTKLTKKQCVDAGMAVVLILLLTGFFSDRIIFYKISIPVLIMAMILPKIFYPFAILWFGISGIIGSIASRISLSCIYLFVVLPVGMIRNIFGKDNLQLKKFKRSGESVLVTRDHIYSSSDLEKPF